MKADKLAKLNQKVEEYQRAEEERKIRDALNKAQKDSKK